MVRECFLVSEEGKISKSDQERFKNRIKFVYEPYTDRWFPVFVSVLTELVCAENEHHYTLYEFFSSIDQNLGICPFGNCIIESISILDTPEGFISLNIIFK